VLEPRLRLGVAAKRGLVVRALRHRGLQAPELGLDLEQVAGTRQRVLAERDVELERRSLVVEGDACPLGEREFAALQRRLGRDRAKQRGLPGTVRTRQRQAILAADRERDVLEQRIARELLAQFGCDEDGHDRGKGRSVGASAAAQPLRFRDSRE
jgi:hypothetical protein